MTQPVMGESELVVELPSGKYESLVFHGYTLLEVKLVLQDVYRSSRVKKKGDRLASDTRYVSLCE